MLKAFLTLVLLLAVVVIGVVAYASATQPDRLHVERSATVAAPPHKIMPLIEDFRRWQSWSPYENKDPAMKRTFSGAESGKGAVYAWDGNKDVGQGRMEIVEAAPERVAIDLHFIRPFEARNVATFTITPEGDGTKVTWAMDGPMNIISKVMGVFFDMNRMIGQDFGDGLAKLKTAVEQPS